MLYRIVHKFIEVNGLKLHVAEIGNISSPAVVFLHGFPEIWYSWRHQMIAVANAGYRAIAPDFRGYGLSDPSPATEDIGFSVLVDDVLAIVDSLDINKILSSEEEYGIEDPVIKNPMLLIVGEKDYFLKFPGVEDFITSGTVKQFASDLEIEYVAEGSHFVQEQFPEKLNRLILAFLHKHS
uniref:Putative epoxide hydrolase n=1 Tax=Helianthus annuus TaxID=4232 RepID=A0A251V2Y3_HELAN